MSSDSTRDAIRQSLHDHLDGVHSERDLVAAARAAVRARRRATRIGIAVVAVVGVLAGGGALGVAHEWPTHQNPRASERGRHPSSSIAGYMSGWRVESYRGVELDVPGSWRWGATPRSLSSQCGPHYTRRTDLFRQTPPDVGYVGRPDAWAGWRRCRTPAVRPRTPYVWFDSPTPVGTATISSGAGRSLRRTTVDVGGVRVTVADNQPAERAAILASIGVAPVDENGCPMSAAVATAMEVAPPRLGGTGAFSASEIGPAQRVAVCLYSSTRRRPLDTLVASDELSGQDAASAQLAFVASPTRPAIRLVYCSGLSVTLIFQGERGRAVAHASLTPPCGTWIASGGPFHLVTRGDVEPWLVRSVRSYLVGNGTSRLLRSFAR
jgi:hypothetical protein